MFYLIIFVILLLFSLLEIANLQSDVQKKIQVFVGAIFVVIAGFRYETGVDWKGYIYYFDNIDSFDIACFNNDFSKVFSTLDIGYALLNSIVKMLGGEIQTVFFIVSLISVSLLVTNLRYYSNYVLTGLLVYYSFFFFTFDLSGLRQGLAMQIMLFSLKYIEQKKFNRYFFYILIATSIHWSALIILPFYFFSNKKISINTSIIILFISIIIFTFQIKWLAAILGGLLEQLNFFTLLAKKVNDYTTDSIYSAPKKWDIYSVFNFVRMSLLVLFCNKFYHILKNRILNFNTLYNLFLVQILCCFCLYEFTEISERLRFYFFIPEIILIPNIIFCFKSYFQKNIAFFITLPIIFLFPCPYLLEFPSTVAYNPYQNYLIYKLFDFKSDGDERLEKHREFHT